MKNYQMKLKTNIHKWHTEVDFFNIETCNKVKTIGDALLSEKGGVLGKQFFSRNCKVGWIPYEKSPWLYYEIKTKVSEINSNMWNFKLDGEIETLQYLKYGICEYYSKHADNSNDEVSSRKLTAIIQLSEKYIGGGLKIWGEKNGYANKQIGSITVFPSHLYHQAQAVLWGKRNVLVAWFKGKEPLR
tara:strand:+ start:2254 stop:2814 length:561 start_codon:yes stop_codon:yes gene_type:complete